jgi:hypothetical protein
MPDTISIGQNMNYDTISVTDLLKLFGQAKTGLESLTSGEFLRTIGGVATEIGGAELSKNKDLVGLGLKQQGLALNPQLELLFTNIDYRTFQFDFLLTPKSRQEADSIRSIIQAFKFYSAPELSAVGRYFVVPSTFDIKFNFQGVENTFVHKLAPSVLTAVVSDYAPQGWVSHQDGSPVQTRLTLQFKETEILTKEKIKDKGY